jgi:hypothetical protein
MWPFLVTGIGKGKGNTYQPVSYLTQSRVLYSASADEAHFAGANLVVRSQADEIDS